MLVPSPSRALPLSGARLHIDLDPPDAELSALLKDHAGECHIGASY